MQCEAILLGREQVDGAVDTSSLASLIRSLLPTTGRRPWSSSEHRYTLRCSDGLEFIKRSPHHKQSKRHDDEGFESDDDSASTRSLGSSADDTISNSSSCCFVDDHVFKCHPTTTSTQSARTTSAARVPSSSTSSCVSSVATDSANSSGASDTEDTSAPPTPTPTVVGTTSVSALVKSLSLFQQRNSTTELSKPPVNATAATAIRKDEHEDGKETYPVSEIAFCHTDSSFPRVVVWVVKKKRSQRLSPSGTDTSSGLEAVVFECSSEENTKKLCESFQETSRRAKLDQYRHPHRRKDTSPAPNRTQSSSITPESIIRALKDASEKTLTSTLKNTTVKPIIKPTHLPTSRTSSTNSTTSGPGSEVEVLSTVAGTRFNLVQRTDGDGVTHIEVSRGLPMENPVENLISLEEDQETCGPSSIISISTPDVGNLLTPNNSKSKFCKEIEGVIRSDVDIGLGPRKEAMQRQRQPAILVIHSGNGEDDSGELRKVWSPPATATPPQDTTDDLDDNSIDPPQRPERKKFVRRQKPPAPQPPSSNPHLIKSLIQSESSNKMSNLSKTQVDLNTSIVPHKKVTSNSNQQMVVRGQFIRVSVDQQQSQPAMVLPVIQQGGWMYGNNGNGSGNLIAYSPAPANWGMPLTTTLKSATNKNQTKNKTNPKKECEEMFTTSSAQQFQTQHYQKNRSRSRNNINANRRSKSPPARRPMAYRYIDTVPVSNNASTLSNRFFGLSQKLREIGGSVVNSNSNQPYIETARRRNSIGELPARFEYFGENCGGSCSEGKNGNLKSVIKKNRRLGEYTEPKKVTFSAYATVQVVD